MSPIKVTTRLDLANVKLGAAAHLRHRHHLFWLFRYIYLVGLLLLSLYFFSINDLPYALVCLGLAPVLFIRKYLAIHRTISSAQSSPYFNQSVTWIFEGKKIRQQSDDGETTFKWSDFHETVAKKNLILLYFQKENFFILPRKDFTTDTDFQALSDRCSIRY